MRLLLLTSRLPYPPDRGDRYRVFNFLKRLSVEHEITLVSFVESNREGEFADHLSGCCEAVHTVLKTRPHSILTTALSFWRPVPLQASYYTSRSMHRTLKEILAAKSFDAAYIHLFRMVQYADLLEGTYRIVDLTDAISREIRKSLPYRGLFSRVLYAFEQARIERYELQIAEYADEIWLISERDRKEIAHAYPQARLKVVPNGVDPNTFRPLQSEPDENRLLFVGNMSVLHNIDAAEYLVREIIPRVQRRLPAVSLVVAGSDPVRRVRVLDRHPAVSVKGFVDDLNAELNAAAVFVAPLRFAAGVQTKVIQAMAAGRPVVTTGIVNEGIGASPGRELLVADGSDSFAEQIAALCRDPHRRRDIGAAARRFVVDRFQWDHVAARMRDLGEQRLAT